MSALPTASVVTIELMDQPEREVGVSDRRADVDAKQQRITELLAEVGCEALLVLDQANLAWLTSGASARNVLDPDELPGLFYIAGNRWLLASNVESQRMFDQEMDELGFLLKEWPWHWRREQLLGELCQGKKMACDLAFGNAKVVGDRLKELRCVMTPYEQACCAQLGNVLAHALEATCRHAQQGSTEREIAGQIGHRLLHRGAFPVAVSAAGDGRSRLFRRYGYTSALVQNNCVVSATARKHGLYATASRAFSFGPPEEIFLNEHLTAAKVAATYMASTWPDAGIKEIINAGKRVYLLTGFEHDWQYCPQGHVTGRAPVERTFSPESQELLQQGWPITWQPTVGAAASADTFLVTETGPQLVTPAIQWPMLGIRVSGEEFLRPHILER